MTIGRPFAGVTLTCVQCGVEFQRSYSDANTKYCSNTCYHTSRKLPPEHFWDHIAVGAPKECWLWSGTTTSGYGKIGVRREGDGRRVTNIYAHRRAWELTYGSIAQGLWVLHKCDVKLCCNPLHLFLGTHQDNMDDMMRKERSGRTAFTREQAEEIRRYHAQGATINGMAREFGVNPMTISRIVNNHTYHSS